jgi:hypothetical protein
MRQEGTMHDDQIPIDPAKIQRIRQYLEQFRFSDVQPRFDENMWTHFTFNEPPTRSQIVFHRTFLEDCKNLDEIMEKSIIPLLIANPGKSIRVGEMGVLSVEDSGKA